MTRRCELTGKLPMAGQLRSHAENKTKRTFRPNLIDVTLISDSLQRKVRLRISAHALKTVEHRGGLDAFLLKAREETLSDRLACYRPGALAAGAAPTQVNLSAPPLQNPSRRYRARSMRTCVRSAPHTWPVRPSVSMKPARR